MGDHVGGSLIAIDYLMKNFPWMNLLIWTPEFLVELAKNLLRGKGCVRSFAQMEEKYDRERTTLSTQWNGRISPMKIHIADYALLTLCDSIRPTHEKNSLKIDDARVELGLFNLPRNFVVLVVGFTAPVREFPVASVNAVIEYVLSKGCTPVFLGQKRTESGVKFVIKSHVNPGIAYEKGLDLIDKTTLIEAACIIKRAKALVGVDCGLMHVAGLTDTPIVGGYTTVRPEYRMPIRHDELGWGVYSVVPKKSLHCAFCQSDTNFLYGQDYRYCHYKDYACVSDMSGEAFIRQLERIL